MRGELRKVLCTRWSAALLAALVALNGVLFYRYCTQPQGDEDYTLPQLRAAYARSDAELQADYDAQWARLDAAEPLTDEVYDEIYLAMSLDEAVLTQRETVRSYPDYARSLREEAEAKQRSGFFGAPDSFAGRSLRRAAAHYAHLEVLAPEPSFSGGITVLTDWRVTDGICAAGGAMAGLLLLTVEQAAGLLCLVRPTKNGRGALFRRKFAALVAELAGLFVLTYGGNLAISAAVLGLGDLRRPVQAVIGLQGCPLPLTAGEYLLCVFAGKLLWLLAAETVFFLLCACTDRAALALGSGFAVGALGLAMQKVPVLWLQSLSLTRLALMDAFLKDCVYLNLFGLPVSRFPAALVFCAAVATGGYAAGRAVFCRKSAVPSVKTARRVCRCRPERTRGRCGTRGISCSCAAGWARRSCACWPCRLCRPARLSRRLPSGRCTTAHTRSGSPGRPRQRRTRFSTPKTSASPRCTRSLSRPPPRRAGTRSCSSS